VSFQIVVANQYRENWLSVKFKNSQKYVYFFKNQKNFFNKKNSIVYEDVYHYDSGCYVAGYRKRVLAKYQNYVEL